MSQLLTKALAFVILATYISLGTNHIVEQRKNLNLKKIEVQSLNSEVKELNLRYNTLNRQLDEAEKNKSLKDKKVKELLNERQKLEAEKKRLEAQLQAKKESKSKLAQTSEDVVNTITNTQTASATSSSKEQWMAQAGISQSDWPYVDEIISRESGWSYTTWNTTGSGAFGLCQALPATKMATAGLDYEYNPVTQLKWCHQYALSYGSWAKAAEFSRCVGSCFSSRTNMLTNKDHQWW